MLAGQQLKTRHVPGEGAEDDLDAAFRFMATMDAADALEFQYQREALKAGLFPGWVRSQEWTNLAGYRADIAALARYGVPLTRFADWARQHAGEIVIDS